MRVAIQHVDEFLKGNALFAPARASERRWWWTPAMIVCFAPIYGLFMGSFWFVSPDRIWQVLFAAIKMPLLLMATSLLCLPGFFVLNTILGLRDDIRDALQAILAGQACLSLALASLGPITRFWYFSSESYRGALLFNVFMFTIATIAGHVVMLRYYRPLIRRHRYHRVALYAWLLLYAFVGIQMGWTLRPFVGSPNMPVSFFRDEPFSNAYVSVARLFFQSLGV